MSYRGLFLLIGAPFLLACGETPDAAEFLPEIPGYAHKNDLLDVEKALRAMNIDLGQLGAFSDVVGEFSEFVHCYQARGGFADRGFKGNELTAVGVAAVAKLSAPDLAACVMDQLTLPPRCETCSTVLFKPCVTSGEFKVPKEGCLPLFPCGDETFYWVYAAIHSPLCSEFSDHFASIR
jgi:hypothetical protein